MFHQREATVGEAKEAKKVGLCNISQRRTTNTMVTMVKSSSVKLEICNTMFMESVSAS